MPVIKTIDQYKKIQIILSPILLGVKRPIDFEASRPNCVLVIENGYIF